MLESPERGVGRMNHTTEARIKAGIALYSRLVLALYDWWFLGFNCRFFWECPSYHLLDLYNRHVSANHLDIGVGTGYFMDKCRFPGNHVRLALMDLNSNSLRVASKRLMRYRPEVYQGNASEPFGIDAPTFDSVGMMNLLHCLPGDLKTKAVVFKYAKAVMNPGAVIFGSTILFRGVKRNPLATLAIKTSNQRGFMANLDDTLEDLRENLRSIFLESSVEVIGCEALFWARK
jgi:2-polyprenyl-3-methyl-5-hydroxy-6-metoxy-1,4-benzoquinol methylase